MAAVGYLLNGYVLSRLRVLPSATRTLDAAMLAVGAQSAVFIAMGMFSPIEVLCALILMGLMHVGLRARLVYLVNRKPPCSRSERLLATLEMTLCSECGQASAEQLIYCVNENCVAVLHAPKQECPSCGIDDVPINASYCKDCGSNLNTRHLRCSECGLGVPPRLWTETVSRQRKSGLVAGLLALPLCGVCSEAEQGEV